MFKLASLSLAKPHHPRSGKLWSMTRMFNTNASQFPEAKQRFIPSSGQYPRGFYVGGLHCGVKKKKGVADLAVILSDRATTASAVFTTNQFCAAPVQFDRNAINKAREARKQMIRAVVTNSGCANAVTGENGLKDAQQMAAAGDKRVKAFDQNGTNPPSSPSSSSASDAKDNSTLVMSTGVIGQRLPIDNICRGIEAIELGDSHDMWMRAAIAHMTTDTFPKLLSHEISLPKGNIIRLAGITKGAGMIHPNMATLLGTVCTDAAITQSLLDKALAHAVARSFNSISIDGDMSTNDTIAVIANGAAGDVSISSESSAEYMAFRDALTDFMAELASLVVRDGEGATKFITVEVEGARTFGDAKQVASTIATSSLVKTAFYGKDANWGRILCAVGYAGIPLDTAKVSLAIYPGDGTAPLTLVSKGEPLLPVDEARASEILDQEDVAVRVELGLGSESARIYTCDLSHDYVSINADYRS
ncbi:glutamate N-acetyltransferase [Coemansia sp. RSA 1646]|nr:glutamate N-acetyltransferase [Coemansia sp. RSA 1646]KAJ1765200.1 glutamate N-acetyltransferase [Coemansia sp. RSA 1843]KAJ2086676.1 glutamate N-acetyltransferase [Coemansia sp. RSA 986]KAJ2212984.1 glutamate N-acetyltransferase [Coemansia sp. RSA 487]